MKTLSEIVRDAILLLDAVNETRGSEAAVCVVIARGHHAPIDASASAYQIRLRRDVDRAGVVFYRGETRSWLGRQWASWQNRQGWLGNASFDVADLLATDWRIA